MKNPLKNKTFVLFSLGFVLTLLLSLVFILGGWYSCSAGGGTLTGLKCINVEVIKACEDISGNLYVMEADEKTYEVEEGLFNELIKTTEEGQIHQNTPNIFLNYSTAMEAIE